jgi:hypothetical protein
LDSREIKRWLQAKRYALRPSVFFAGREAWHRLTRDMLECPQTTFRSIDPVSARLPDNAVGYVAGLPVYLQYEAPNAVWCE